MCEQAVRRLLPLAAFLCLLPSLRVLAQTGTQQPDQLVIRELATATDPDSVTVFVTGLDGSIRLSREAESSLRQAFGRSTWVFFAGTATGDTTGGTTTGTTTSGGTTTGTTTAGTTTGGMTVANVLVLTRANAPLLFTPALRGEDGGYVIHNAAVTRGGATITVLNGKITRGVTSTTTGGTTTAGTTTAGTTTAGTTTAGTTGGTTGGTGGFVGVDPRNQGRADLFLTTISLDGTVTTAYISVPMVFSQLTTGGTTTGGTTGTTTGGTTTGGTTPDTTTGGTTTGGTTTSGGTTTGGTTGGSTTGGGTTTGGTAGSTTGATPQREETVERQEETSKPPGSFRSHTTANIP